jgi:hypothetical protein
VYPRFLASAQREIEGVIANHYGPPLRPSLVDEFRWYCHTRRALDRRSGELRGGDRPRYVTACRAFGAGRLQAEYREWLKDGDRRLNEVASPLLHDALRSEDFRIEAQILSNRYLGLDTTVTTA